MLLFTSILGLRGRQLTRVMTQSDFNEFETNNEKYHFVTMTNYDSSFKGINVIFQNKDLRNTLGEVLEKNNKTQLRIAETEKYPHVTFSFQAVEKNLSILKKNFKRFTKSCYI